MWIISPWWHNGNRTELANNAPSIRPGRSFIEYEEIWMREREDRELAYNPRFLPNIVTFDKRNRPVIRAGVHDTVGQHATIYRGNHLVREAYLQTLDASGVWIALSIDSVLKDILEVQAISIRSGTFQPEERVAFDATGDAYTVVSTNIGDFLLHAPLDMKTWRSYQLPTEGVVYRIELTATDRPPVIFVFQELPHPDNPKCSNGAVSLIAPAKLPNGSLTIPRPIEIASTDLTDGPSHSGGADVTLTLGNKTHVVYTGTRALEDQDGTPQYITTYDHNTRSLTRPILLGTTQGSPGTTHCGIDAHNGAAIVADSQGQLHVVLGSHQHPFKYTRSKRPNDSSEWTRTVDIGASETYVGLVIDKSDTLHLVSRRKDATGRQSLHYMRKRPDDRAWVDLGDLVVPKPTHYSIWYHKLTVDRRGVLFLAYFYYSHNLSSDECAAYKRKWPREAVTCDEKGDDSGLEAHDPVVVMSGDGGDTWKIATTADFLAPWVRLSAASPALSDGDGWSDVANYSTIQTAVVGGALYLVARANKGITTWKFNAQDRRWLQLTSNDPALSDDDGWSDVANYSTIQTAVVGGALYLVARANKGITTWKFNAQDRRWLQLTSNDPALSDDDGWSDVANYSTIQTAVVGGALYLVARANKGITTWKFNAQDRRWLQLTSNDPALSDDDGWSDVANYSTIQTAVVGGALYLVARANKGITTWKFNAQDRRWLQLTSNDPALSDDDGWSDVANYSTIQTAVVGGALYLVARANKGITTWKFNAQDRRWLQLTSNDPALSDDDGWNDVANYSTIQTAVVGGALYLLARAGRGMHTWKLDPRLDAWVHLGANMPVWADVAGWDDVTNYATIQTAVVKDELCLLARANNGMHLWTRRSAVD